MPGDLAGLLAADLAGAGFACRVEGRDRLAVVYAEAGARLDVADEAVRRRMVGFARQRGFTHVAVALTQGLTKAGG
jgi:hypothetical protein